MLDLCKALKEAPSVHVLSANYRVAETCLDQYLKGYHIFEKDNVKIGVFGLGIKLEGLVSSKNCKGVEYEDPREKAAEAVAVLREQGCQLVVALSHLGYEGYSNEVGDIDWPKDVTGVDYVVGGHTHTLLSEPTLINHRGGRWQTAVMQVGHSGLWLGSADFQISARHASLKKAGRNHC